MALFNKDNQIPAKPAARTQSQPQSLMGLPASDNIPSAPPRTEDNASKSTASESRLIVGPNIKLKGVEIEDCDTLVVEGYVEASMDSRVIEIAEDGVYKGKVEIDTAIIRGRFEGHLTARDRLVIHSTGDVDGTIRYGKLTVEEGGRIHGDMDETGKPPRATASAAKDDKKDNESKDSDGVQNAAE